MPIVRSICGVDVNVGQDPSPNAQKRLPKKADFVCTVVREGNMFASEFIDHYYISYGKSNKFWILWCEAPVCWNDRYSRQRQPLTWCDSGIGKKDAASAMLRFIWETDEWGLEASINNGVPESGGLLSLEEVNKVKGLALGELTDDDLGFKETRVSKSLTMKEAGPDDPIYKSGWIIGKTR